MNASAPSSSTASTVAGTPSPASSIDSARTPTITPVRPLPRAASGTSAPPNAAVPPSPSCTRHRFIDGEPTNAATNVFTGRSNSSRGVAHCCSFASLSTATRWPSVIASAWSWVTNTVVTPSRACSDAMSARICTRSCASRLESGSSIRNTRGRRMIARPIATRWRWPPDSWPGLRSRNGCSSSISATSCTRCSRSAFGTCAIRSGNAMFAATVR